MADDLVTPGVLFGICNPLLDISAEVPLSLLEKYTIVPKTASLAEERHASLFSELVNDYAVEYIAGGAGQNSMRCAQWMLQKPGATTYVGCVGDDEFARQLKAAATADGVDAQYLVEPSFPTGTCAVLIHDKDRSLVANLGAANHYKKSHLDSALIRSKFEQARVFYATGFFLTVSPESLVAIGEYAESTSKIFTFNISAEFLVHAFMDPLQKVLPYADVVFANETEAAAYGRARGWGEDLAHITQQIAACDSRAHKHASKDRKRMMITTRGPLSAFVSIAGEPCIEFPAQVVPEPEIVDTNGAGDAFVGGFLAYYVLNAPLATCMAAGHYAASQCIRQSGAKFPGKPTFQA